MFKEETLKTFFRDGGAGEVEDIFWVTDKETQQFYGTTFITFSDSTSAKAATALSGSDVMGRPVRIE